MNERTVYLKVVTLDGSTKIIDMIGDSLLRLKKIQDDSGKSSYRDASLRSALKDAERMEKERAKWAKVVADEILRTDRSSANNRIKEAKRAANGVISELERIKKANEKGQFAKDLFSGTFLGSFLGGSAGSIANEALSVLASSLGTVYSIVKDLTVASVKLAGNFQVTTNALGVFTGGTRLAKEELAAVDSLARNSVGLRLESAQEGYLQLRALGFQAETSRKLLKGLAMQKIFSGADEMAIQRVIVNLIQLSNGSSRASQDLKEMVHALPSLRNAMQDAFGTIDSQKVAKLFTDNPDKAIAKLADAMSKGKEVVGGFNDSFGKLLDSFTRVGRYAGEPLLDPLSKSFLELSDDLENNRDVIRDWSETAAKLITQVSNIGETRLVSLALAIQNLTERFAVLGVTMGLSGGSDISGFAKQIQNASDVAKTLNGILNFGAVIDYSAIREAANAQKEFTKQFPKFQQRALRSNNTVNLTYKEPLSQREIEAQQDAERRRNEALIENNRQKMLENLKNARERESSINSVFYATEEAKLQSYLENTLADRLKTAKSLASVQQRSIRSEIAVQTRYYDDLLKFGNLSAEDREKTEREKNLTLFKLNGELIQNEAKSKKLIAEIEKQIQDERRKALIDFNNLQIRQYKSTNETIVSIIEDGLSSGFVSANSGYQQIIALTQNSYGQVSKLTRANYQEQLDSLTLTKEQRLNLITEMYSAEQDLADENFKKISKIQDEYFRKSVENFENQAERIIKATQMQGSLFSQFRTNVLQSSVRFGSGFAGNTFSDIFGSDVAFKLGENINKVLSGRMTIYQAQKDILEKTHLAEQANAQREIDLNNDLIALERIRIKNAAQLAVINLDSRRQSLINQKNALSARGEDVSYIENQIRDLVNQIKNAQNALNKTPEELNAYLDSQSPAIKNYKNKIQDATEALKNLKLTQSNEKNDLFNNATEGLKKLYAEIREGSKDSLLNQIAENQAWSRRVDLITENKNLIWEIAHIGEDAADRYQNAWLRAVYEVKEANIRAVEDQIRANVRLADSATLHVDQIRARVLTHLSEQKTLSESLADGIISAFDKAADFMDKRLGKIAEIPIIGDLAKFANRSFLTKITTGLLDKFLPSEVLDKINSTGNPVLDENIKQTNYLKKISDVLTGKGSVSGIGGGTSGGGFSIGGILGTIFGGGGTAPFNPNGGNFFANNPAGLPSMQGGIRSIWDVPNSGLNQSGGGGIWGNIKNLFSTGQGGIFAPQKNMLNGGKTSRLGGIMGGVGSLLSLAGGAIGGRFGGILSMAGTGAQIGAMFGPWGAAIGAGIGALAGLFGGDPKRKRDKNEKLPQLQSGFADALAQLRQLLQDTKSLRVDPDSALSKAQELRTAIASGFGIQFESKKYGKQAQSQIQTRLSEADSIITQIREAADISRTANARNNRILPEFSTGGFLGGTFDRKDDIIARLSRGEMVLNPSQMSRVRALSGFDVFAHAGIPNYPKRESMPKFADGGMVVGSAASNSNQPIVLEIQSLNVQIGKDDATRIFVVGGQTSTGQKVIINGVKNDATNNDTFKREILR